MRFAHVPHPTTQVSTSMRRELLEGNDPLTGKPVIKEIINALTKPLTDEGKNQVLLKDL